MSPPLRRVRAVTCDCVNVLNTTTINSSSSGGSSSQPPSSGFRGSSTLLTDSEMDLLGNNSSNNNSDNLKNLFVYQYDSPAELSSERPPSGRIAPKSILRRATQRSTPKSKRNSMFEEQQINNQAIEKRRSLQDPYFMAEEEDMDLVERVMSKVNNSPIISMQQINSNNRLPTLPKMREYEELNAKLNKIQQYYIPYNQPTTIAEDIEARMRAENFLSHVPKSELKHYAEIANILDTTDAHDKDDYDRSKLRNEVSRALSQRKVSFNDPQTVCTTPNHKQQPVLLRPTEIKFSTPPNSPNMSTALKITETGKKMQMQTEKEKMDKIQSNRFKRLQIQWELLSKEGNALKQDLDGSPQQKETKSGGNTPTSADSKVKSRIPRPVSYPTSK